MASGGEVILCEALIDAMTFWVHGFRNVTASYGAGGFTDDHLAAFRRHGVKRVLVAYDRDDAGNQGVAAVAERLAVHGIDCYRILFPKGMDANQYALKMAPTDKALALFIRKAEWIGEGRAHAPAPTSTPLDAPGEGSSLAADAAPDLPVLPPATPSISEPALASPQPPAPRVDTPIEQTDAELVLAYGDRRYRVCG